MIQMIAAPMPVSVQLGEDEEEGQAEELQGSVTRTVQASLARLRRFFAGDWRGLWDDAKADRDREQQVRTEEEQEASKI